ncbi:YggS family pyridoxal phosphate-dependent enzyme [Cupriavidus respiraculi]|uniref:Pyridoxal phosphate homeostasis protein n=1 Tax=Cupriavidus respiraculi TaxID=195930 RepID=A0ABM8XAI7_9BURK|nr:YggS family pyridoxal phosphate-dependent enzyme [Cupriavidus respiraculi]CAG9177053.1 Pyridoxal phosphate homeostasis protein [Cupriavidus respiraculi]
MSVIVANLQAVRRRLAAAEQQAGRPPGTVALLAVSKTFSAADVRIAHEAGQHAFGENYVQEGGDKIAQLADLRGALQWHFIGPLQSNKTRAVAEQFDWVHSVDRLRIAERLSSQRPASLPPLQVCIQVNISAEASKGGVDPAQVLPLAREIAGLSGVRLRGLMAIPAPTDDPVAQRKPFARMRELMRELREAGIEVDTLSMGMSDDMEAAIAEGATMVRIGTAIFGARPAAAA